MIIARIIRKWFRQQDDFAALGEQLRQFRAGEIDHLELPPGVRYQALLPECPKCGYRAEGDADGGQGNAESGGRVRVTGDLARPEIGIVRDQRGSERVISPLAEAEGAEACSRHRGILPSGRNEGRDTGGAKSRHGMPPIHFFIDRIHRRIMGGKRLIPQGETI